MSNDSPQSPRQGLLHPIKENRVLTWLEEVNRPSLSPPSRGRSSSRAGTRENTNLPASPPATINNRQSARSKREAPPSPERSAKRTKRTATRMASPTRRSERRRKEPDSFDPSSTPLPPSRPASPAKGSLTDPPQLPESTPSLCRDRGRLLLRPAFDEEQPSDEPPTSCTLPSLSSLPSIPFSTSSQTHYSRSSSPVKARTEMKSFTPAIHIVAPQAGGRVFPEGGLELHDRLDSCCVGEGVIPREWKTLLEGELQRRGVRCRVRDFQYYDDEEVKDCWWEKLVTVFDDAGDCACHAAHESNWIAKVVRPMIAVSVEWAGMVREVEVESVESIAISPLSLLPRDLNDNPIQVKKVDYILALRSSSSRLASTHIKTDSLNQTLDPYIRHRPVALNIEVKRQHGVDPLVQLGIWTASGFLKRRGDGDAGTQVGSCTPGLTIVGHHWDAYLGYWDDVNGGEVVLYGPIHLGRTDTFDGTFQILAALRKLCDWAVTDFKNWFEEVVWARLEGRRVVG